MFSKPWFRCVVSLLVVCVLLINCSPIKAEASMTGTIAVGAGIVIASALIGLGVCAASDPSGFDGVVSSCQDFLADAGYVINGAINVAMLSPSQASFTYGLSGGLIDTIRSWLFGSGGVVSARPGCGAVVGPGWSITDPSGTILTPNSDCYFVGWYVVKSSYTDVNYFFVPTDYSSNVVVNYTTSSGKTGTLSIGSYDPTPDSTSGSIFIPYYRNSFDNSSNFSTAGLYNATGLAINTSISKMLQHILFGGVDADYSFVTDAAVNLAKIAAPAYTLAKGYAEWFTNTVTVPGADVGEADQDEVVVYPVGIGQTYEETRDKVQTDVWTGTSSYVDTSTDTGVAGDTVTATGLKGWLDAMLTAIGGWFSDVIAGLRDIGASIISLPQAIADAVLAGITAIFVPSADFLTAKVEAIRAEFAFADAIISTGEYIGSSLSGLTTEPPVIYVNLGDTRGSYNLGGKVAFLDLRWYAEYKPVGDAILSAFLWLCFAWRMFVKLPAIIGGLPGEFFMKSFDSAGMKSSVMKSDEMHFNGIPESKMTYDDWKASDWGDKMI